MFEGGVHQSLCVSVCKNIYEKHKQTYKLIVSEIIRNYKFILSLYASYYKKMLFLTVCTAWKSHTNMDEWHPATAMIRELPML